MAIKGPFGLPRPAAREQLTLIIRDGDAFANFSVRGPLGGPRPFARPNPGMSEYGVEEVRKEAERNLEG